MKPQVPYGWSQEGLLNKAQRFANKMVGSSRESWEYGFWSALALEVLARATVASLSPTLLADGKEWNNILYALGYQPVESRFRPRSIDINVVLEIIEKNFPDFTPEMKNFCLIHIGRRNAELHTGDLVFDGLGTSQWLGKYFQAAKCLLDKMNEEMSFLFGDDEAQTAETFIKALHDDTAKEVKGTINAHQTIWKNKNDNEKKLLSNQSKRWASRRSGHRCSCPSCRCVALLSGSPLGPPRQHLEDDSIVVKQSLLPSSFECAACGLKISGYSKLSVCGLGDTFTATSVYDAAEYFAGDEEGYFERGDDFND